MTKTTTGKRAREKELRLKRIQTLRDIRDGNLLRRLLRRRAEEEENEELEDGEEEEFDPDGIRAAFGVDAQTERMTYRELQERRETISRRLRNRV